ncbi:MULTISPECIES: tripartite tricarboxylate transporter permease [unclassified Vibrio]|uniref:Tripartite tricarboxylate transporter permease n=1 Tax=Vibrio sp. HB236076 TaxID=3232307 RepID=A0AB39HI21_9VIBR|nr:tripartite tricarboxylate transporter permease [Vibrio sp. HB161653]MDP5254692.1 tripartite tricarboxylate transporter permease [Vibrio sp. HB161653]
MMDIFNNLINGFGVALQPYYLFLITFGGILGTVIGMLPGLGPATGVAVLLPMTFSMGPTASLITMTGVYIGAMFGGSRSSILINTPGDGAALAATFDGYPMAMKGRAESALAISAIASLIGGTIAAVLMTLLAEPVASFAIKFGPAEYFLLMVAALTMTISMSKGNMLKGFLSMCLGLAISTVGIDGQSGLQRFTFGNLELQTGIDFLVVIIGIYAMGEVFKSFKTLSDGSKKVQTKFKKIWISKPEWQRSKWPILRSAPVGFIIGALPGAGGTMASLMCYNNEKQLSKQKEEFGQGAIEGLAAPESANNAASIGAMIPMLSLGVPGSGTTAVMMGALLMLGIQPGPLLFTQYPETAWGLIASMFVANIILAFVNIPLAGVLVRLLAIPAQVLYPIVLGLAFVGCYAISASVMDFYILILLGIAGVIMGRVNIPTAPMILAAIVGSQMEQSFRQAFRIANQNLDTFAQSGISQALIAVIVLSIALPILGFLRQRKRPAAVNETLCK